MYKEGAKFGKLKLQDQMPPFVHDLRQTSSWQGTSGKGIDDEVGSQTVRSWQACFLIIFVRTNWGLTRT